MPGERKATDPQDSSSQPVLDPSRWVQSYGDVLFRYAMLRVRRHEVAEDLVQETLLAALGARNRFAGQSSEQTWLIGILVRKITDYFRKKSRQHALELDEQRDAPTRGEFDKRGHWIAKLGRWPDQPAQTLENREFWAVFDDCLSKLEPTLLAVFSLRELERLSTEEICKILEISPTNLGVRMYRARSSLRSCLEVKWFEA
jgi:RNA polymerase sigma-70 factor (ECF subfamily)